MKPPKTKDRESLDLVLVLIVAAIFSIFSISINFIDRLYNFFNAYTSLPIAEFLINVVFLSLAGLLWLRYRRWREAAKEQVELENIIESISPDVLMVVDPDRNIIVCNASVKRMFGYEVDEVINQKTDILYFDRRSNPGQRHEIFAMLEKEGFHAGLATGKKKNGESIPLEIITGNLSGRHGAVLLLRDITERKRAEEILRKAYEELEIRVKERTAELRKANENLWIEITERKRVEKALKESEEKYRSLYEKMKDMAQKDPLTGLFNHGRINELLEHEIERSKRGSHVFSVMMLDVDGLKLINDTHGHIVGDKLLKDVANILRNAPRSIDYVGRYGGDEFLMVLPYTDGEKAKVLAQRISERIKQKRFKIDEKINIPIRLSIGVATYPFDSTLPQELISLADTSMYESKRSGKSVVTASVPEVVEFLSTKSPSLTILEGLVAAVDSKDRYTRAHSDMVTDYALSLAKEIGLSHGQIEALKIAGLLHDIGKIGIPDTILRKPGPLEKGEFEIIKQHPRLGALMLGGAAPHQEDVMEAIMYHHERYDGKGYPGRLKGEDIPLLARIIAITDAYCAMITDRPYRKALTRDEAIAELKKNAGTQFDPDLVSKFLKYLKESKSQEGFHNKKRGNEGLLLYRKGNSPAQHI